MTEQIDTIIIGGGQGGLSTSYHLTQQGREHVILEQADQAAEVWRNRWDSFTLNTPNWMTRLPGAEYNGDDPDGFIVGMASWPTLKNTSSGSSCRLDTESA